MSNAFLNSFFNSHNSGISAMLSINAFNEQGGTSVTPQYASPFLPRSIHHNSKLMFCHIPSPPQIPIYQIKQGCSVPLEPKIAGALKIQLSNVALHKHSVIRTTYGKLHSVAALYLKGHIIGRERMRHRIIRMVARNFRALCHHRCRNGQTR